MAAPLSDPSPAMRLLDVGQHAWCCIAEQLERGDRIRLAATCRTLREALLDWFRSDVFELDGSETMLEDHIAWLGSVGAGVFLEGNLELIDMLNASGVRIVGLSTAWLEHVPPELEGLPHLRRLALSQGQIEGGWQHLPLLLEDLDLYNCGLEHVPAKLAGLTRLRELGLFQDCIQSGWQHLPRQLHQLNLHSCDLQQVPAELAGLTELNTLSLSDNPIEGGWQHLPRQLQQLDLSNCRLQQAPAVLTGMTQLTQLSLRANDIRGGWQHLPQQLEQLDVRRCGLQQVPPELAGLKAQLLGAQP